MRYLSLDNHKFCPSCLGLGCLAFGGYGVGFVDDQKLEQTFFKAIDSGINFFDTADIYGLGRAELFLGKLISKTAGLRSKLLLASKFGVRRSDIGEIFYDNSIDWIEQALMASLERLQTDYLDLYQLHYPDNKTPIEEVMNFLDKKRQEGVIRYFGVSNVSDNGVLSELAKKYPYFITAQMEGSLIHNPNTANFPEQIAPIFYGVLAQGLLSGKYDKDSKFAENDARSRPKYVNFHGEKLAQNLEVVERLKVFAKKYGMTPTQMAFRWVLDHYPRAVALIGAKDQEQLIEALESCSCVSQIDWTI